MKPFFKTSVHYVPGENVMELFSCDEHTAPVDNTTAGFTIAFDGYNLILARNLIRGFEIAGGHIEPGETAKQAAMRELYEETGCKVNDVQLIIRSTLTCKFEKPLDYKYPFPVSHMDFFMGDVTEVTNNIMVNEVGTPIRIPVKVVDGVPQYTLSGLGIMDEIAFKRKMNNKLFAAKLNYAVMKKFG